MDHNVYLLATDPHDACRDVIHSRDTALKIRVFCLDHDNFEPDSSEIQLYGYAAKELFAFETINLRPEDATEVLCGIKWYAGYLGFPDMEILPDDPRRGRNIAV